MFLMMLATLFAMFAGAAVIDRVMKQRKRSRRMRARVAWAWGEREVTR